MIWFFLFLLILGAVLQKYMAGAALNHISCSIRNPGYLIEPGEPFRLILTIENRSRLPVFFLRLLLRVPEKAELLEGSPGKVFATINATHYRLDSYLLPRRRREYVLQFLLPERGVFYFQDLYISCGDLLGIKEQSKAFPNCSCSALILPCRPRRGSHPDVLGGLMGERTVQRWLHEDPVLSSGFRDYTEKESMKNIAWNRSLQSGKLMVRQLDHTTEEKTTVLLCNENGAPDAVEGSLRVCRSICEQLEQRKLPYSFLHSGLVFTGVGMLPPLEDGLGTVHINHILEGLCRATPNMPGSLDALMRKTIARDHDACCYVLIVPSMTEHVRLQAQLLKRRTGSHVEIFCGEDDI